MRKDMDAVKQVKDILSDSHYAVFFGGAGVSTDSGIPDFRGTGGLYNSGGDSTEYYLSNQCLYREPEKFFRFFRENMLFQGAGPNDAHRALAELEHRSVIRSVITQNIDGLHQKAGSQRVIELHGAAHRHYCTRCGKVCGSEIFTEQTRIPKCKACGGMIRPDVTLYGEALDGYSFAAAEEEIRKADVLIVGGTSLVVNPAASLVGLFEGKHLIIINYTPTPYDCMAEFIIRDSISDVMRILAESSDTVREVKML